MTKALYRKYRPTALDEVVGQEQVTKTLARSLAEGKVNHAYLFIGPRGTGKTSVARIFAHAVNGFDYVIEDDYVDIIEIDGASNRGIDNIRELREKVAIAPTVGKYKVYIIDEVHMLTKEAFNALLKTLEEPPEHVIFIMATTDAHKVPVTITSRAQTYTFQLAGPEIMLQHLKTICEKEKIPISDDALQLVAKRGGGSFRDSLSLLDQISTLSSDEITKEVVEKAIGLPDDEKIDQLLRDYVDGTLASVAEDLRGLLKSGVQPETLVEEIISRIIERPETELMPLLTKLPDVKAPYAEAKLLVALMPTAMIASEKAPSADATTQKPFQSTFSDAVAASTNFNWESFMEAVQRLNDAIYSQLKLTNHAVNGSTLDIYPLKKITKNILSRDNNKKILIDAANGMRVMIHEVDDNPFLKKDALISKMSDIMGGEVVNDGGDNPF